MTDEESLVICAIRYCIGRRTYIVGDGQRWAREWGARSRWVRDVIRRDLREAVRRCDEEPDRRFGWLGDPHDEASWRTVLADLDAMAERERTMPDRDAPPRDVRVALREATRALCRERCADMGEPPCYEVTGDRGEVLPWPPETCDCGDLAWVPVAAFLRALPDRFPLPRSGGETWGHAAGEMRRLADAVDRISQEPPA